MNATKLLITGGSGQLGKELINRLDNKFHIWAPNRIDFNLELPETLRYKIQKFQPDMIVNCAAFTSVDLAESSLEKVSLVNTLSPKIMAEEAKNLNIPIIHISTDYVFDGNKGLPYSENDPKKPINVYGISKLKAEEEIQLANDKNIILRTSWIYNTYYGVNFYRKMINLFKEKDEVKVVFDQIGSPTNTTYLSKKINSLILFLQNNQSNNDFWGVYHLSENYIMSWYEFSLRIFEDNKNKISFKTKKIIPIKSDFFPTVAKRPKYSALNCDLIKSTFNFM
tara:strand:+ start:558 stop:1400 length:843 start_codon:yes stop_codon:yes gene_type:complete